MDIQREEFELTFQKTSFCKNMVKSLENSDCPFTSVFEMRNGKYRSSYVQLSFEIWQAAKAQTVPEGFVLMPKEPTKEIVEAFWNSWLVEQPNAQTMFFAYKAMIEAQDPQIIELKVEWASDCFKCGHHEAIIYSTAAEASTKGWFHDGDEAKCTGCGNTGEMDAQGEDSNILWNDDEEDAKNA